MLDVTVPSSSTWHSQPVHELDLSFGRLINLQRAWSNLLRCRGTDLLRSPLDEWQSEGGRNGSNTYPPWHRFKADSQYEEEEAYDISALEHETRRNPDLSNKPQVYADGTSIDWLHEEALERERQHQLRSLHGLL